MRSFIALPIDKNTTDKLYEFVQSLQSLPWAKDIKWFPPENYHLTLQFLGGKLSEEKVQQVMASMDNWFAEGMTFFEAEIVSLQTFPNAKAPHTLIAKLDSTIMMQSLVREIEDHLKPIGLQKAKQAFRPHISLGRIPAQMDSQRINLPNTFTQLQGCYLKVDKLTLFKSQLTEQHPIYTPLKTIQLDAF